MKSSSRRMGGAGQRSSLVFPARGVAAATPRPHVASPLDGTTLVSKDGSFELGFFNSGSSTNRYLGIWYKNIPVRTVVWVANRCNPINDSSGMLMINGTGNLVLLGQNKSVVWWTSSVKNVQSARVQLLDSGNLVLRDVVAGTYLWQSFDYPSDTLLPGMKMGWDLRTGVKRSLSAWKNSEDPCPGDFTYGIQMQHNTYPEAYVRIGTAKYDRTGPWNGLRFSGSPELKPNPLYSFKFVYNEDEVYYMYNLQDKSVISRIVLNQTTRSRDRFTWIEAEQTWRAYSSAPRDMCDHYGFCGANGNCIIGENPVCQCLKGFRPKSQEKWNLTVLIPYIGTCIFGPWALYLGLTLKPILCKRGGAPYSIKGDSSPHSKGGKEPSLRRLREALITFRRDLTPLRLSSPFSSFSGDFPQTLVSIHLQRNRINYSVDVAQTLG